MTEVTTALISGFVALLVGGVSALLTFSQIRREHRRWLTDLKSAWSIELYKSRMATYPAVHEALSPLSHTANVDSRAAAAVAEDLNSWIYSAGGLCADAATAVGFAVPGGPLVPVGGSTVRCLRVYSGFMREGGCSVPGYNHRLRV
jgi:hypothetical protein